MNLFLSQFWKRISHPVLIVIAGLLVLVLSVSGPFGTYYEMGLARRVEYWAAVVLVSILVSFTVWGLADIFMANANYWLRSVVIAAATAGVLTPMIITLTRLMTKVPPEKIPSFPLIATLVVCTSLFVAFIRYVYIEKLEVPKPRLFDRLADPKAKNLTRMTVRDHYVDVFTDRGKETLLMRFSDALNEIEGLPGLRVHRSHWVAAEAVKKLHNENGRDFLILNDGSMVPVSRGYRQEVLSELNLPEAKERRAELIPS